jgi:hypothetical protein
MSVMVSLTGGLGNQLFQIAAALKYAQDHNYKLLIDDSFGNYRRNKSGAADIFSYQNFFIPTVEFTQGQNRITGRFLGRLTRISLKSPRNFRDRIFRRVLIFVISNLLNRENHDKIRVWCAQNIGYQKIPLCSQSVYLLGYFQTYRYASSPEPKRSLMNLRVQNDTVSMAKKEASKVNPLVVHIRLGDYLQEPNFGVLSSDYYERAISFLTDKYEFGALWVFSDDIEKAKVFFPKKYIADCRWMGDQTVDSAVTLETMRFGRGYVIGNSSFSWWAAFLSYSNNPPVVAPNPWFTGMEEPYELCPPHWIRIAR